MLQDFRYVVALAARSRAPRDHSRSPDRVEKRLRDEHIDGRCRRRNRFGREAGPYLS